MKLVLSLIIFISLIGAGSVNAQNLQNERIRSLPNRKMSVFQDRGIFHNGAQVTSTTLKSVRYNYSTERGYERVVLDFSTPNVPKIYGYISPSDKKIYIDLFDTQLVEPLGTQGQSHFVESLNFFPITEESLSVELNLKEAVTVDIFTLESPGRLVIDIKK